MRTEDDLRTALAALAASAVPEPDTIGPTRRHGGTRSTRSSRKWQGALAIAAAVAAIAMTIPLTTHESAPAPVPGPARPTSTVPAPTTVPTHAAKTETPTPAPTVAKTAVAAETSTVAKGPTVVAQVPPRPSSAPASSKTVPATQNDLLSNISDGEEVGIAASIVLVFPQGVVNKAAVTHALTVTTSAGSAISGAWVWGRDHDGYNASASEVHFRPTSSPVAGTPFWPAGTSVTVTGALAGLDYGAGSKGKKDLHLSFKIRPQALIIRADAQTHQVTVIRDGQAIATYATTLEPGLGQSWSTPPGIHVITEKSEKRVFADQPEFDQAWSMRLGNIGSFIHSGAPNSHDIGLSDADAKTLYQLARYGDPVIVTNTLGQIDPIYDVDDWNLTAQQWTAKSLATK